MKNNRLISLALSMALLAGLFVFLSAPAAAAAPITVLVNDKAVSFPDVQPFLDKANRVMVPVRFVTDALGGEVEWIGATRSVTLTRGRITAGLTIDKKEITVLGVKKTLDTAPILQKSRTLVPLRFVAEAFGCNVVWVGDTRTVKITDTGKDTYKIGEFSLDIGAGDKLSTNPDRKLNIVKESGLIIVEGVFGDKEEKSVLTMQIKVDIPETDIPKQREQAKAILRQCLSEKLADEIMAYVAPKKTLTDRIAVKDYKEGRYEIAVSGGIGPISIKIYII